ncbi:MAG: PP2C family protein-serine/threonine phosphatase [Ruminococcus sp.]|nr:PP2C family protein-serine/threonine phosphatase [Ruminococcus sp.]
MKAKKKNRRLLFQVEVTTVFCFILAIVSISIIAYKERNDAFLEDKNELMSRDISNVISDAGEFWKVPKWAFDLAETNTDEVEKNNTNEEYELIRELFVRAGKDIGIDYENLIPTDTEPSSETDEEESIEDAEAELDLLDKNYNRVIEQALKKAENEPYEVRLALVRSIYSVLSSKYLFKNLNMDYSHVYFVDIRPETRGFIFASLIGEESKNQEYGTKVDFDINEISEMLISGQEDTVYEYIGFDDGTEGNEYYAAFKCIESEGKPVGAFCLLYDLKDELKSLRSRMETLLRIGTFFFLMIGFALVFFLYFAVLKPLLKIKESVAAYMDTKDSRSVTKIVKEMRSRNEIGVLAEDISELAIEIDRYTNENVKLAEEKQRVSTELDLASKIQTSMLSTDFPQREEFEIFASMTPAKEVGGDFYDFFFIDESHLGLAIADVSGKGVPASLFMMISEILIREFAKTEISPKEVLEKLNSRISENNPNDMFVTVWFGIMDISTGHVTAANAGHEYPIIKKADGNFELFKDKHGLVVGAMEGIRYREYEFEIEKNGVLFLYTDGAPEATDEENKLFGTDRMIETLNRDPNLPPEMLVNTMKESIDEFVGEAPQFDDLTMLCIKYNGK